MLPDFKTTAQDGGKVVSLTQRPLLPLGNTPGTHFCQRLSRPPGHSATGRIMSLKNSNDNIGNRAREPAGLQGSALTTTLPSAPRTYCYVYKNNDVRSVMHAVIMIEIYLKYQPIMYVYISGSKLFFYVVRHLDSIASYLSTGLHLGFFRSWPSLFLPSSFSSVFLVLAFVLVSTSVLF